LVHTVSACSSCIFLQERSREGGEGDEGQISLRRLRKLRATPGWKESSLHS